MTIVFALSAEAVQAAPPANDNFGASTLIATVPFTDVIADNAEASLEPGEQQPQSGDCGGSMITDTVWYRYQPPASTTLQADTLSSTFDTMVAVWTGSALGSLTEIACNDQVGGNQSAVVFPATGGVTYYFQVGGWEGETGSLRFTLGPRTLGEITGTVTAEGGGPLPDICVTVVTSSGSFYGFGFTGGGGSYAIPVESGSYRVLFEDFCDAETNYVTEWYDDQADFASANDVAVPVGMTTGGIDAALALGGSITGTVTAVGGGALRDICVTVFDANGDEFSFGITDLAGAYFVGGLPTGSYRVNFLDGCDSSENHIEEWFNDKADFATADPVAVTQGIGTSGINAALVRIGGPASPAAPKTVSLKARPKRVERGERVKLTVFVSPCPGIEGQIVELYRGAKKVQAQATNTLCGATFRIRVQRAATFRAVSPQQDPDHLTGSSEPVKVKIRK